MLLLYLIIFEILYYRFKTEMLCQLSDFANFKNAYLICATNCPWDLDTAILRRFQHRLYVPMPNRSERLQLLKFFLKGPSFSSDALELLMNATEGYSGSDLANLVQNAQQKPIIELTQTKCWEVKDGMYRQISGSAIFLKNDHGDKHESL